MHHCEETLLLSSINGPNEQWLVRIYSYSLFPEEGSSFEPLFIDNTGSHFYVASSYNCGDIHNFSDL